MSEKAGYKEERFPVIPIRNQVLWRNPDVNLPYYVEEGHRTDLGVFLVNHSTGIKPPFYLEVEFSNHRVGILPTVPVSDRQGNIYYDSDLKGIGYVSAPKGKDKLRVFTIRKRGENDTWGLWNLRKAYREVETTEHLQRQGIRTYRIGAIIKIDEVAFPNGDLLSVEEARERGIINDDEFPIIGLRHFRSKDRVRDDGQESLTKLVRAKDRIEREIGNPLTWEDYIFWFATTIGVNLGKIHNEGYWHGWPSSHNLTLAAEIVDFGFSEESKKLDDYPDSVRKQKMQNDFVVGRDSLNMLVLRQTNCDLLNPDNSLLKKIFESYESSYKIHHI